MMSEQKKLANRRNARRSTGPRTPEGKRAAAQNATRHGLLAREVLLPGEDAEAFAAGREELLADLHPVGALERLFAERIVVGAWKLRRVSVLEAGVLAHGIDEKLAVQAPEARLGHGYVLAEALIRDGCRGDQFSKLTRYEAMWAREVYRALHELQRLQAARRGQAVAPPVAVDVTLSATQTPAPVGRAAEARREGAAFGKSARGRISEETTDAGEVADSGSQPAGDADPPAPAVPCEVARDRMVVGGAAPGPGSGGTVVFQDEPGAPHDVEPAWVREAQAKVAAQQALYRNDPLRWLLSGPGRERPGRPGWVEPAGRDHAEATVVGEGDASEADGDGHVTRRREGAIPTGATATASECLPLRNEATGTPEVAGIGSESPEPTAAERASPLRNEATTAANVADRGWPTYVAAHPISVGRLHLRAGEEFPVQDKQVIRGYGLALGVPDADLRALHELPYVAVRWRWW